MKPSSICLTILVICAFSSYGCKSPTSATTGSPYVTIHVSSARSAEFVIDTFQARIFNHDFAQTYFLWNMGDSTVLENYETTHGYTKPGNYTVKVDALDIYSHTIIASASTSILIDTAKSSVEIIPQFYTGVLPMTTEGFVGDFSLSVQSSLPESVLYEFWDFGDGTTDGFKSGKISHFFPRPGTYLLKVDVYQKSGVYVGSDTAAITINWPPYSQDSLKSMKRAEVFFSIDSTFPLFAAAQPYLPLVLGIPLIGISSLVTWNGNSFSFSISPGGNDHFQITGFLSKDAFVLDSIIVSARGSNPSFHYEYALEHVPLLFVNPQSIVFEVRNAELQHHLKRFSFTGKADYIPEISALGEIAHNWGQFIFATTVQIPPFFILAFSPN